jgi:hypothetical protein
MERFANDPYAQIPPMRIGVDFRLARSAEADMTKK